jgi:hypothetical protein
MRSGPLGSGCGLVTPGNPRDSRRTPGHAAKGARRELYGAALQQFDELIEASRNAGHTSRPLPLFYALSQAGRAVVAAHGSSGVSAATD